MNTLKGTGLGMLALVALASVNPAMAMPRHAYPGPYNGYGYPAAVQQRYQGGGPRSPMNMQVTMQRRIQQGIRDGQLTSSEAKQLIKGEQRIRQAQRQALADGNIDPREYHRIQDLKRQENQQIYHQTHDNERR